MSIATVVTRGYGSFGSIAEIVTRGFSLPVTLTQGVNITIDDPTIRIDFAALHIDETFVFVSPMDVSVRTTRPPLMTIAGGARLKTYLTGHTRGR